MQINYSKLFAFSQKKPLVSRFHGSAKLAQMLQIDWDEAAVQIFNPEDIFQKLQQGQIADLEILQAFALMAWESAQWHTPQGMTAMQHWWQSALKQDAQGKPTLRLIMQLRCILADTERYPAPKEVVRLMREVLQQLICSSQWPDQHNIQVLQALIASDAQQLARVAFSQAKYIPQLMQELALPTRLPVVTEAQPYWLQQWMAAPATQRQRLRPILNQLLHDELTLKQQQRFAHIILNTQSMPTQVADLERKVKDFPELVVWLSACARQAEFKLHLNPAERQRLACWIGTGNYEALREILEKIAHSRGQSVLEKTVNRYIFWKNYQALFQEAWLLLPQTLYAEQASHLSNIKPLHAAPREEMACIVLKIGNYFVFQTFLGDASQNDLLMSDDIEHIEQLLGQNVIDYPKILQSHLVLIHDHVYMWQTDLAYLLDRHFQLPAKDQRVYYAEHRSAYSQYLKEVEKSDFIHERRQWKNLPKWVANSRKLQRYPTEVFNAVALTAKRYHLLD